MDTDKKIRSGPGSPAERRSTFSLGFAFKTPSRRLSIVDPPDLSPTCAERGHYPVFNPLDPRHNPSASVSWRRQESQTSSSDSQKQSHWVQDFPRRSLHKARSGLLALRAGFLRRHRTSMTVEITPVRNTEASSASTQEDLNFGVALYRTNVPWSPAEDEPSIDVLMRAAAFHPLANIASAPEVRDIPIWGFHDPDAVFSNDVTMAFHPTASKASYDGMLDSQKPHKEEASKDGEEAVHTKREPKSVREAHPVASADWETIESSSTSSTGGEDEMRDFEHAQTAHLQEQIRPLQSTQRVLIKGNPSMSHEEIESDDEHHGSPSLSRQVLENRRGSFMRRSSGVLSTLSSNTSHRRRMSWMQSEAFATQERLLLFDQGPPSPAAGTCSTSSLGKSSADVPIAFPVNFLFDSPHRRYEESMLFDPLHSNPQLMESFLPESDPGNDMAPEGEEPNPTDALSGPFMTGNDALAFDTNINMQPELVTSTQPEERRHSFGLHISTINESRLETSLEEQILPLENQMYQQQYGETNCSSARVWGYDAADSMFQSSTQSSIYTRGSTMSPDLTSITSFSNMCSPLSSPIDEEVLFSNPFRNEFWNADGKTSSLYPDRGDQPVKAGLLVAWDGGVHSGRGFDRIPSSREHQSHGIRMPTTAPHSSQGTVRAVVMREESESTDEFYPGAHVPETYRR
ncbi:uncharacterized protein N7503_000986 [Penicillium pulvis]|uniref:uncharacterized protein n=1 Tax=Penicillium pulvis TaxID=1562058 RepID=UPI0025465A8E|nr:uncharacterized protein N7503_000986 [Penicillium pulvis]KAJ5814236.1 hypothetical protein N7503_000986 [Penicillium pulvis]